MGAGVAILAGESSGDAFGAMLATELRGQDPACAIWGLGGPRMRHAGVEIIEDIQGWAAIGVVQSLRVAPRLRFRVFPRLLRAIEQRRPSVVVPIDFGAFNVPVCRWCKARGFKVLYFMPPGSWRKAGPLPVGLAAVTDRIATQFPWSAERLKAAGASAEFVGHPLLDIARPRLDRHTFLSSLGLDPERPVAALLPGSRTAELAHNSGAMFDAAVLARTKLPELQIVIALAGGEPGSVPGAVLDGVPQPFMGLLKPREPSGMAGAVAVRGWTHDALAHADAAIVCSGTATLEAAILGVPMVIIYRGSGLMRLEYAVRRIGRIEHVGLPNIVAGRRIVRELIAEAATPGAMADGLLRYLLEPETAARVRDDLRAVRELLGQPGACARTARMVLGLSREGIGPH